MDRDTGQDTAAATTAAPALNGSNDASSEKAGNKQASLSPPARFTVLKRTGSLGSNDRHSTDRDSLPDTNSSLKTSKPASVSLLNAMIARSGSAPPDHRTSTATASTSAQQLVGEREDSTDDSDRGSSIQEASTSNSNADDVDQPQPQIDQLLLDGLRVAKDRILLLRSDLELEAFVSDSSRTRLRIAPPSFPPALNSYQRLLIHRLADLWNVTRELEPLKASPGKLGQGVPGKMQTISSTGVYSPNPNSMTNPPYMSIAQSSTGGSTICGTIVLVKSPNTKIPPFRIASLIPPTTPETSNASAQIPSLASKLADTTLSSSSSTSSEVPSIQLRSDDSQEKNESTSGIGELTSSNASSSSLPSLLSPNTSTGPSAPISPSPIRIMSRAQSSARTNSLGSLSSSTSNSPVPRTGSSVSAGSTAGLTYEEREAAYLEARTRIFNTSNQSSSQNPGSKSSSTATSGVTNSNDSPNIAAGVTGTHVQQQLQPSALAPHFVYPASPGGVPTSQPPNGRSGQRSGQQQYSYYNPQQQTLNAPPIQITMPSLAMAYNDPHSQGIPYMPQQIAPGNFQAFSSPMSRPTSSRSVSSHSSISTTTSASSMRASSASYSAQGGNRQNRHPTVELRPTRQGGLPQQPYSQMVDGSRHGRPALSTATSSSQSSASRSHHSHSSSSASTSTSTSNSNSFGISAGVSMSGESTSGSVNGSSRSIIAESENGNEGSICSNSSWTSSNKGKGRSKEIVITPLSGPHPSLPKKPVWVKDSSSGQASSLDSTSTPQTSSYGTSGALANMSTGSEEVLDKLPPPEQMSKPPDGGPKALSPSLLRIPSNAGDSHEGAPSGLQKSAGPAVQPQVIEYPPLRYDPNKGWTSLDAKTPFSGLGPQGNGTNTRSSAPANNQVGAEQSTPSSNLGNTQGQSRGQTSARGTVQQHRLQDAVAFQQGFPSQSQQQYQQPQQNMQYQNMLMPVGSSFQGQFQGQQMAYSPNGQYYPSVPSHQAYFNPHQSGQVSNQGQFPVQTAPLSGGNAFQYTLVPVPQGSPVLSMQGGYIQQPGQQQVPYNQTPLPHVPEGYNQTFTQQHYPGGLTANDIMAQGEMLYSYDIPRPMPRSGATLFDPNAITTPTNR